MKFVKAKKTHKTELNQLFNFAKKYLKNAHSPYSHVKVASAVLVEGDKIFGGCNIENASYGGTICAERVAITKAASEGYRQIKAILVVTNQKDIWPPCGLCRQVIAEFAKPESLIFCTNLKKEFVSYTFAELFPGAFDSKFLK